jgi:uncharacterized protein YukE
MGYPAYGGSGYVTQEQIEAQQRAIEEHKKQSHDDGLKGHEQEISNYEKLSDKFHLTTDFTAHDLESLKGMIEHANPDGADEIGRHWKHVHTKLVGEGGAGSAPSGDSAYGQLKKAVEEVLEHWEGESADKFRTKASKILQQIANGASHALNASEVMSRAAHDLRIQQKAMKEIEPASWWDCAWDSITDSGRDDKYTKEDIKSGKVPKDLIASANEGYIGAEKEQQLKAVAVMETLGRNYVDFGKRLKVPYADKDGDVPPSNPDTPMPTPIPTPSGSASVPSISRRSQTSAGVPGTSKVPPTIGPRDPGISGGQQLPGAQTRIDGLPSGISGGGADSISGGGSVRGGIGVGGAVSGAHTGTGGGLPGGGMLGGAVGARGSGSTGGVGGRAGIGGAGAMGRGGSAAGSRGAAAGGGGRGPLARAKGGVAGAPKGIGGGKPATPGGTGLGKGRNGQAGRSGGMLGGARGSSQRPDEEAHEQGNRPDYLIEDEETWTPDDDRIVPKTIE